MQGALPVTLENLLSGNESVAQSLGQLKPSESVMNGDPQLVDMLQFGKFYNAYFACGMASLILLIGINAYIWMKHYQRQNPLGIMFNLVLVQILLTCRVFMVGLFFQIW